LGEYRAVKIVRRHELCGQDRPFEREFEGIKHFEPISRSHPSQLAILHVGKNEEAGYFYYVMELADPLEGRTLPPSVPGVDPASMLDPMRPGRSGLNCGGRDTCRPQRSWAWAWCWARRWSTSTGKAWSIGT